MARHLMRLAAEAEDPLPLLEAARVLLERSLFAREAQGRDSSPSSP